MVKYMYYVVFSKHHQDCKYKASRITETYVFQKQEIVYIALVYLARQMAYPNTNKTALMKPSKLRRSIMTTLCQILIY